MMRIVKRILSGRGRKRSGADGRRAGNAFPVKLRKAFLDAGEFVFSGGARVLMRDQPDALAHEDKQQ